MIQPDGFAPAEPGKTTSRRHFFKNNEQMLWVIKRWLLQLAITSTKRTPHAAPLTQRQAQCWCSGGANLTDRRHGDSCVWFIFKDRLVLPNIQNVPALEVQGSRRLYCQCCNMWNTQRGVKLGLPRAHGATGNTSYKIEYRCLKCFIRMGGAPPGGGRWSRGGTIPWGPGWCRRVDECLTQWGVEDVWRHLRFQLIPLRVLLTLSRVRGTTWSPGAGGGVYAGLIGRSGPRCEVKACGLGWSRSLATGSGRLCSLLAPLRQAGPGSSQAFLILCSKGSVWAFSRPETPPRPGLSSSPARLSAAHWCCSVVRIVQHLHPVAPDSIPAPGNAGGNTAGWRSQDELHSHIHSSPPAPWHRGFQGGWRVTWLVSGQHSPVPSEQQGMQHIQYEGAHEAFVHTRPLWFAERRWWSPGVTKVSLHQQMPGQHFMYIKKKKNFNSELIVGIFCL